MKTRRGRPRLGDDKKRVLISLKLDPQVLEALGRIDGQRTRLIEDAIIKTYNLQLR